MYKNVAEITLVGKSVVMSYATSQSHAFCNNCVAVVLVCTLLWGASYQQVNSDTATL